MTTTWLLLDGLRTLTTPSTKRVSMSREYRKRVYREMSTSNLSIMMFDQLGLAPKVVMAYKFGCAEIWPGA